MAGIYRNQTEGIISLSSDGTTRITIADKNLGATSTDITSTNSYGYYYQWGNNYGFPTTGNVTTYHIRVDASTYGPGNYYNSSTFIISNGGNDRDSSNNLNLWGGETGTVEAMRGPCDEGYHIPSATEWNVVIGILLTSFGLPANNTTAAYLKLPLSGARWGSDGNTIFDTGVEGYYWGSTANSAKEYATVTHFASSFFVCDLGYRNYGYSIRPFKNEAIVPDYNDVWNTLYGDELPDRPIPPMPKLKWLVKGSNYYYFDEAPIHASGITLNESSITLTEVGQTEQLTATITPDDAINKKVLWSSSDTTVATVSSTGLVTCVTPGECTITATCADNGISTSCSVIARKDVYADFLLVAGGGGGGTGGNCNNGGGGGGAGGLIYCENYLVEQGNYSIVIGSGGAGQSSPEYSGLKGGDSCFGIIKACGGGGGAGGAWGYSTAKGGNGGSGGGSGSKCSEATCGCDCYGTGISGQGNRGGTSAFGAGGGGGGACTVGYNGYCSGSTTCGGNGGYGCTFDISGQSKGYAGGGGGAGRTYGGTGVCGGGDGTAMTGCGANYYGGGGGGGRCAGGGSGYKGIFIIRYPTSCGYSITGGCCYTCGNYTIHCFTSNGTLTVS